MEQSGASLVSELLFVCVKWAPSYIRLPYKQIQNFIQDFEIMCSKNKLVKHSKTFDKKCTNIFMYTIWTCVSWSSIYVFLYLLPIYTYVTIALRNLDFKLKFWEIQNSLKPVFSTFQFIFDSLILNSNIHTVRSFFRSIG